MNLKQARQLYDCYIECNGKQAIEKFKDVSARSLRNYNQIADCRSFGGRLRKDVVLIDIDDMTQAEVFYKVIQHENVKCRVYKTDKGMHFLFKNKPNFKCNKSKLHIVLGLKVDVKTGNAYAYESIKIDGVMRELIYDIKEGEFYDELPNWAYTTGAENATKLFNLTNGDGRNDILHRYVWSLQYMKFKKDEVKHIIRLINRFVFKMPLTDAEVDVILRDDSFLKEEELPVEYYDEKGKLMHHVFAKYIIDKYTLVKLNKRILMWNNGVYKYDYDAVNRAMRDECPELTKRQKIDIWDAIGDFAPLVTEADKKYIAFKNGIYNDKSDSLEPFDKNKIILQQIPFDYDSNIYSEEMDNVLNDYADGDPQKRMVFEELLGACFTRRVFKCFFILLGDGDNGKSALMTMFKTVVGSDNISTQPPDRLSGQFSLSVLVDKLANFADDIHNEYIGNASVIKNLTSGGEMNVEEKYKEPFKCTLSATHVFAANDMPSMEDSTGASSNRMIIIPLTRVFKKVEGFADKICNNEQNMKYLVRLGIEGLKRLNKQGFVSDCDFINKEREEFRHNNNPILAFIDNCKEIGVQLQESSTKEMYDYFVVFCKMNQFRAYPAQRRFSREICRYCGFKSVTSTGNVKVFRKEY